MTTTTKTFTATTTDGTTIEIKAPAELPTEDRAEYLRGLWDQYVEELEGHWKGAVRAEVPECLAEDVAEAMGFMGAHVDAKANPSPTRVQLFSKGYWAHGY